jgi:hypothetical protein
LDPEATSNDQSQQVAEVGKWRSLGTETVSPKRGMLQAEDGNLILPIHAGTLTSAKPLSCMCRRPLLTTTTWIKSSIQEKAYEGHLPDLTMDEVSPR